MLEELGIQQKDTLLVLNKIDALPTESRVDGLLNRYPQRHCRSAPDRGIGMANLAAAVSEALSRSFLDIDVEMGVENGRCWPIWPPTAKCSRSAFTTAAWWSIAASAKII